MLARVALATLLAFASAARAEDPFPGVAAAYLVIVDGAVRWEHRADAPRAPASLSKLMAALLAADEGALAEWVTVSARAARARGARLGLRPGDQVAAHDLLAAMLVGSANDACYALAERQGSVGAFVARMNARAAALELRATRFADPCGFDARGQHSTARDLARLAQVFMQRPPLAALAARREVEIADRSGRRLRMKSSNVLLEHLPGTIGVKTGETSRAGRNLIALAVRDGRRVLLVMLGARDRWWDAHAILERALAR